MARSRRRSRRSFRCSGLGGKGIGTLLIAGVVGIGVGAAGYYMYLARKSAPVAGLGLLDIHRY